MTDVDHGITDADVIDETIFVSVWRKANGLGWGWEIYREVPYSWHNDTPEYTQEILDAGTAATEADAEAAAQDAKENEIRRLTSRK